jgi:hypothetical protein
MMIGFLFASQHGRKKDTPEHGHNVTGRSRKRDLGGGQKMIKEERRGGVGILD